ncbi:hypothetical protein [Paraburkholderia terricola]|uniref:hypothetical protein n=1 Tax=Paraburkholderia terricola TaxID=169427 RepID=UPI003ED0D5FE
MATVVRNVKIPATTLRVTKAAAEEAMLRAMYRSAVHGRKSADQVIGSRAVTPSVKGIAEQKRAAALKRVRVAVDALGSLVSALDGDDPAAADLAQKLMSKQKFRRALSEALGEIHRDMIEAPFKEEERQRNAENTERMYAEATAAAKAKEQGAVDGALKAYIEGNFNPQDCTAAEDMAAVERAREKLARLKTADALGDAGDIVAARFGYEPRAYDADDMDNLIDRLSGKTK